MQENYVYLLKNNKILKLLVTIDPQIIKENLIKVYQTIPKFQFGLVSESTVKKLNLPIQMTYIGKVKLNGKEETRCYNIPDKGFSECDLFYLLNKIYNQSSLTSNDIYRLNLEREYYSFKNLKVAQTWVSVVEDIISKLNIEILDQYDYNKLSNSLEYLEQIEHKEKLYESVELNEFKNILLAAEGNNDVFEDLGIEIQLKTTKQKKKNSK